MTRYCEEIASKELETAEKNTSANSLWQSQMLREGAHAHIVQAMQDFGEERELQLACLEAFRKMASGNSPAAAFMTLKSVPKVIMSTGLGFYFDPEVTGKSASILGFFASQDKTRASTKVMYLGGMQFCSDTLERHPDNAGAIVSACELAVGMSEYSALITRSLVADFDLPKRLLELMQKFPKAEDGVQLAVLKTLDSMSSRPRLPDVHAALVQSGVIEGLAFVMRRTGADVLHRFHSTNLISTLTEQNSTVRAMMLDAGLAPLLASSLDCKHDVKNVELLAKADSEAMRLLGLFQEVDTKKVMVKAGVAEMLEKAQRTRPKNEALKVKGQPVIDALRGISEKSS